MKVLDKFCFCPVCGSPKFKRNSFKSIRCLTCGFTYYNNASAAVVAVILNGNNQLLVSVRRNNPAAGTYDLPGGFVDPGETIEEALVREIKEETGRNITLDRFLFSAPNTYLFSGLTVETTDCFFSAHFTDDAPLVAADDVERLLWIPLDRLDEQAFGLTSIRTSIPRIKEILKQL